jgi:type III secretion protein L
MEQDLADLVLATVRRLIQRFDGAELAIDLTRSALATMRSEKRAQLHVPPEVYDPVRAALPELLADYPEIELIEVVAAPGLAPPSLRLESALGVVDFVPDETLDGLRRLLKGG